jgi:adenylyltransferase/sulfurtransferase
VEAGVLGALVGVLGSWQALEAIKLLVGTGELMVGRLLILDGLAGEAETVEVKRRTDCDICSDRPTIHQLIDYEVFCGLRREV